MCGGTAGFTGGGDRSWLRPFMCFGGSFGSSECFPLLSIGMWIGGELWGKLLLGTEESFWWFPSVDVEPMSAGFDGLNLLLKLVMSTLFSAGGSGLAAGMGFGLTKGLPFINAEGPATSGFSSRVSVLGFGGCLGTGFRLNFFTSLAEILWPHSRPISLRSGRALLLSSFLISGGFSGLKGADFGVARGIMTPGAGGFGGKGLV